VLRTALARISLLSQPATVADWLAEQMRDQAPAGRQRPAWLAGRVLLAQLIHCRPLPVLHYHASGKPSFIDTDLPAFNISHSGDFVFVAMDYCDDIGCDIEVIRERRGYIALARHAFSPQEYRWLTLQLCEQRNDAFWRLWTAREAILKQRSASVWQMRTLALEPETLSITGSEVCHWREQGVSISVARSRRGNP